MRALLVLFFALHAHDLRAQDAAAIGEAVERAFQRFILACGAAMRDPQTYLDTYANDSGRNATLSASPDGKVFWALKEGNGSEEGIQVAVVGSQQSRACRVGYVATFADANSYYSMGPQVAEAFEAALRSRSQINWSGGRVLANLPDGGVDALTYRQGTHVPVSAQFFHYVFSGWASDPSQVGQAVLDGAGIEIDAYKVVGGN